MAKTSTLNLAQISVRGVVQGVGFRPFIYQLAIRHNLKGWVCNTSEDVKIEVEGTEEDLGQFIQGLSEQAPPLSHIEDIAITHCPPAHYETFEIRESIFKKGRYQLISPDIATCPECLQEILSTDDRRYRYPFTNCTNCGPRFTIIKDIPYDRPKTTMQYFQMCPECQQEYKNPLNRRFHAQPNACSKCGPQLELLDAKGNPLQCDDVINMASQLLREGKIVAVKGLGGFLLACDATSEAAINLLRQRKKRPSKPFAVMITTIGEIKNHCYVNEDEEKLLISAASPIVLLYWKKESAISPAVAPSLKYLGVMLPYTPLHHLLLRETGLPLVMTSGNKSEEPIASGNDEAIKRLAGIADYFLIHNRDIYARYDDSVTMVERSAPQLIRRARGYAPHPIHLYYQSRQILGCGAEEKNTFCLTRDRYAFLSQHIGDMENYETLRFFEQMAEQLARTFRVHPKIIACDMHPGYLSTRYAERILSERQVPGATARQTSDARTPKLVQVQHHHAHIASCMAENGFTDGQQVIGVALDGTGYGTDGAIWGGEFLIATYGSFQRAAHLKYVPLPGGDAAIRRPYRVALAHLWAAGIPWTDDLPPVATASSAERSVLTRQLERGLNTVPTSSVGRLFDAVAALAGVRQRTNYEAQAAIELENVVEDGVDESYPFDLNHQEVDPSPTIRAVVDDVRAKVRPGVIAARFHNCLAAMILDVCLHLREQTGLADVALSGGVFQNVTLLGRLIPLLQDAGFAAHTHRLVPANDAGVSLGQAVIAGIERRTHSPYD